MLVKKIYFILIIGTPSVVCGQLSETLLNEVRYATDEYYLARDTLEITGSKSLPSLDVYVNDKGPYRFLIDLGSNVVLFKESIVSEAGVNVLVDREAGDIVAADKIQIGNSYFLNVHGASYKQLDVDGVIGFNLVGKGNFMMDYINMAFSFIDEYEGAPDSSFVKFEKIGRMPYLKSHVGEKSAWINFDTGASLWLYFPLSWKDSIRLSSELREFKEMRNEQTGSVLTYIAKIKDDVEIGNYIISSPEVIFDPDIEDIFIGSSLLSDFRLYFYPETGYVKMVRSSKNKVIKIPENQRKDE